MAVDDRTEMTRAPVTTVRRRIQRFSRTMIQRYLDRAGLSYIREPHGDFLVDFDHDEELNCALTFVLMAVGNDDEIYGIEARSSRRFPEDLWDWCLYTVNEWNKRMRYPKAFFLLTDGDHGRVGEIRLEQYTDLSRGAHQELIDNLTYSIMGGATRFWAWLDEQAKHYRLAMARDDRLDG